MESTLTRAQVCEWHKAFSVGCEDIEKLSHVNRLSTSLIKIYSRIGKNIVFFGSSDRVV